MWSVFVKSFLINSYFWEILCNHVNIIVWPSTVIDIVTSQSPRSRKMQGQFLCLKSMSVKIFCKLCQYHLSEELHIILIWYLTDHFLKIPLNTYQIAICRCRRVWWKSCFVCMNTSHRVTLPIARYISFSDNLEHPFKNVQRIEKYSWKSSRETV